MFCETEWRRIQETEVQRANRIYCVRRAERSDSGVRVQRAFSVFLKKNYPYYFFVVGLLSLFIFDFFVLKNERGELKG